MMMTLLLAAAAASAAPQPGEIKTYGDWTVGCDNGWRCQAGSLFPEPQEDDLFSASTMTIVRDAGAGSQPVIAIDFDDGLSGTETLWIDGQAIGGGTVNVRSDSVDYDTQAAMALAAAMLKGSVLEVRNPGGTPIARVSLAGISAALRYMDDRQQRAGTVSALVARGSRTAVPLPPPLPVIVVPSGRGPAFAATPAEIANLRTQSGCAGEDGGTLTEEAFALDGRHTLLLISCGNGAYNYDSMAYVARHDGRVIEPASFDFVPGWSQENPAMLVNASFDTATGRLLSHAKGRGIGDCGMAQTMVWDGARFRLVEATEMAECRGNIDWITTWRAAVRR